VEKLLLWWWWRGEEDTDNDDGPNARVDATARGVDRSRSDFEAVRRLRLTADMIYAISTEMMSVKLVVLLLLEASRDG
jgi:hypothetical protein